MNQENISRQDDIVINFYHVTNWCMNFNEEITPTAPFASSKSSSSSLTSLQPVTQIFVRNAKKNVNRKKLFFKKNISIQKIDIFWKTIPIFKIQLSCQRSAVVANSRSRSPGVLGGPVGSKNRDTKRDVIGLNLITSDFK